MPGSARYDAASLRIAPGYSAARALMLLLAAAAVLALAEGGDAAPGAGIISGTQWSRCPSGAMFGNGDCRDISNMPRGTTLAQCEAIRPSALQPTRTCTAFNLGGGRGLRAAGMRRRSRTDPATPRLRRLGCVPADMCAGAAGSCTVAAAPVAPAARCLRVSLRDHTHRRHGVAGGTAGLDRVGLQQRRWPCACLRRRRQMRRCGPRPRAQQCGR